MLILRNTGAASTRSEESKTGTSVLVYGFEMGSTVVPLHQIEVKSSVVTGSVAVGICKSFPIPDVTFIIGNDIGGGNVWKNDVEVLPHMAVPDKPLVHHCAQQHPDVLRLCVLWQRNPAPLRGKSAHLLLLI